MRGPNAEALGYSRVSLRDKDNRTSKVLKSWRNSTFLSAAGHSAKMAPKAGRGGRSEVAAPKAFA